jgi:hypothetical protein
LSETDASSGFASVESEQLLTILELLDRHVNLAVNAQLIHAALEVMQKESSPSEGSKALSVVSLRDL